MSLITRIFPSKKHKWGLEYVIDKGGLKHSEAKIEAKKRRKQGLRARISPYEGQWATWIKMAH